MSGLDFLQGRKNWSQYLPSDLWRQGDFFLNTDYSPAGEVHLITSQVDVGIREHGADLPEEQLHEVVRGVQDGVHRSEGARGFGARVTGREQIRLAWEEKRSIRCVFIH